MTNMNRNCYKRMGEELNSIYRILDDVQNTTVESVLVTIIHVDGSAYLREGSTMLIKKDGTCIGVISPGCMEEDLVLHSQGVFVTKRSTTLVYDMESDWELGIGTGCNGTIYVTLEFIDDTLRNLLASITEYIQRNQSVILQKKLSFEWDIFESDIQVIEDFSENKIYDLQGLQKMDSYWIYTQMIQPKPRLIIFGAGIDVKPVAMLATTIGLSVTVCDWRPALCNKENIPFADHYVIGFPDEIMEQITFSEKDCVIIMTHHFQRDQEIVAHIIKQNLLYVGIMGSKKRTKAVFHHDIPDYIHYPIGLSIGAKGPEEIAISIIGEIIKELRLKETYL